MQRRTLVLGAAVAAAAGIIGYLVLRSPEGSQAAASDRDPTTSPKQVGALTMRDTEMMKAKSAEWAADLENRAHPAKPAGAAPSAGRTVPSLPGSPQPTAAASDPANPSEPGRQAPGTAPKVTIKDSLARSKESAQDRVKGMSEAREAMLEHSCKAPEAQARYSKLGPQDRMRMKASCSKFGIKFTD